MRVGRARFRANPKGVVAPARSVPGHSPLGLATAPTAPPHARLATLLVPAQEPARRRVSPSSTLHPLSSLAAAWPPRVSAECPGHFRKVGQPPRLRSGPPSLKSPTTDQPAAGPGETPALLFGARSSAGRPQPTCLSAATYGPQGVLTPGRAGGWVGDRQDDRPTGNWDASQSLVIGMPPKSCTREQTKSTIRHFGSTILLLRLLTSDNASYLEMKVTVNRWPEYTGTPPRTSPSTCSVRVSMRAVESGSNNLRGANAGRTLHRLAFRTAVRSSTGSDGQTAPQSRSASLRCQP